VAGVNEAAVVFVSVVGGVVDAAALALAAEPEIDRRQAEVLEEGGIVRARPQRLDRQVLGGIGANPRAARPARKRASTETPVWGSVTSSATSLTKCWKLWLPPTLRNPRLLESELM
jgi:hypothetical protein